MWHEMATRGTVPSINESPVEHGSRHGNVFGHETLAGNYRSRLEANGRLVLPAALRGPFVTAGELHVLPRRNDLLWILTPQSFELMVDHVQQRQPAGMVDPETRARFFKSSPKVSVDRQARFVIPPDLRERVGLGGEVEVVMAGAIERVEIWPAARYDAVEAPKATDIDMILDGHEGLPTGTA